MANSIEMIKKYLLQIASEKYGYGSLTSVLDGNYREAGSALVGADTVMIPKMTVDGLINYTRATGYGAVGDINLSWVPYKLTQDRGRMFALDAMDADEAGITLAQAIAKFVEDKVVPEVDAYRFAKYATGAGTKKTGSLTKTTVVTAIDEGEQALRDAGVNIGNVELYMTSAIYSLLKQATDTGRWTTSTTINRNIVMFDEMPVQIVPSNRFYTAIDLLTSGAGGYSKKTETGKDINFLMVSKGAVFQCVKHNVSKIITPEANQTADGWLAGYRLYHDAFVVDGKSAGIYAHTVA